MPYSSRRWPTISRVLMPRAYIETILSSKPGKRRWYLAISRLRVEARLPVPGDLELDLAGVGEDALAAVAVAAVAGLLTAEMMIHLRVQRPLGQCLLQAVEEAVRIERRLRIGPGQKLVEDGVGDLELFASRHVGAPSLPSCPLTHEIPDRAFGTAEFGRQPGVWCTMWRVHGDDVAVDQVVAGVGAVVPLQELGRCPGFRSLEPRGHDRISS